MTPPISPDFLSPTGQRLMRVRLSDIFDADDAFEAMQDEQQAQITPEDMPDDVGLDSAAQLVADLRCHLADVNAMHESALGEIAERDETIRKLRGEIMRLGGKVTL